MLLGRRLLAGGPGHLCQFESAVLLSVGGQGGRKSLPDGVSYRDYIRPDGTFDVFAFRAAVQVRGRQKGKKSEPELASMKFFCYPYNLFLGLWIRIFRTGI